MNERLRVERKLMLQNMHTIRQAIYDIQNAVHTLSFLEPMSIRDYQNLKAAIDIMDKTFCNCKTSPDPKEL